MPPERCSGWHFGDAGPPRGAWGFPYTNLELLWGPPGTIFSCFGSSRELWSSNFVILNSFYVLKGVLDAELCKVLMVLLKNL